MPKRSSKKEDEAQAAVRIVETVAENSEREPVSPEVSAAAKALGRRGGLKGGPARAATLTAARRAEIARKAAAARWRSKQSRRDTENEQRD